jgi:hypothetical protein
LIYQDEFKLTRSGTVPSAPLREPTPDENDWQQPLQANARKSAKHSSANNAEEENHDQVFSLRPLYPVLTGEPQIAPTVIKTPIYYPLPTSEKSNSKSTPYQEAKDGLNHTEYHPISNTHTIDKKTTKFYIAIPNYEQSEGIRMDNCLTGCTHLPATAPRYHILIADTIISPKTFPREVQTNQEKCGSSMSASISNSEIKPRRIHYAFSICFCEEAHRIE